MTPITRFFHSSPMRRLGKVLDRYSKRALEAFLDVVWPPAENRTLSASAAVRTVLLVRPNFRIGNTLLATALVSPFQARFPGARIAYLGGDTTARLLDGLPIERVYSISRLFLLAPWRFVLLFVRLRREHFDLAVDCGMGSFSGSLYAYLSGANERLGAAGRGTRFLTVRLEPVHVDNAYDVAPAVARALGVSGPAWPLYHVSPAEQATALAILGNLGLARATDSAPFVAAFVGGHSDKRWSRDHWLDLLGRLGDAGVAVVVFVGPEEHTFEKPLHALARESVRVVPPQPLRTFASLLARATLLLTPDSGPMHLGAALGVPIISLIQTERSRFYAPHGPDNRVLFQPTAADVVTALRAHPRWALVAPMRGSDTSAVINVQATDVSSTANDVDR